jgi:predicted nucleic acid-binding protein
MEFVIDTSAVLAVVMNEPEKPALVAATAGAELVAPGSLPWEIGNALSAMFKRRRITVEGARGVVRAYEQVPIKLLQIDVDAAVSLAAKHNIYAYDAYMLICAQVRGSPLLTLDSGLVHAAKAVGVDLVEVRR